MFEAAFAFLKEEWTSGVEIAILAAVIYYIYSYLKGTHGARILIGLALIFLTLTCRDFPTRTPARSHRARQSSVF
jgi:hypothetical protein